MPMSRKKWNFLFDCSVSLTEWGETWFLDSYFSEKLYEKWSSPPTGGACGCAPGQYCFDI